MIALISSCTGAISALLTQQIFSYCCYGALVFGLGISLIQFLRGYI